MAATPPGHEIRGQVGVQGVHRRLVGGSRAEPDEAVRPDKDGAAVGHAGLGRIEISDCGIDNRDEPSQRVRR